MNIKLFTSGLVAASFSEGRVAVAHFREQRLIADVMLPECSGTAFFVSEDGARLVTGYYYSRGIDVWELPSGKHLARVGKYRTVTLLLDFLGEKALIWGRDNGVVNLKTGEITRILNLETGNGAMLERKTNSAWVTLTKRRLVGHYRFDTDQYETFDIGDDLTVWNIKGSPVDDRVVLMGNRGRQRGSVACYERMGGRLLWMRTLRGKEVSSRGSFTGSGEYFLIGCVDAQCTIVVCSRTGDELKRFGFTHPKFPLDGNRAMNTAGKIIDAEEGRLIDSVNQAQWWRKAGLKPRDELRF